MIYYPLAMLMLAGLREILIISTPEDLPLFRRLLKGWQSMGTELCLRRANPAARSGGRFPGRARRIIAGGPSCLILGDNIFFGQGLPVTLRRAAALTEGALIFALCGGATPKGMAWWKLTKTTVC